MMIMSSHRRRPLLLLFSLSAFIPPSASQQSLFDTCKDRLDRILNGTLVFNGIDNVTIHQLGYLYHGPVGGLRPEYARYYRDTFITITTEGCKAICEDPVDWYWTSDPSLTLGIVSNWILPIIALLAALPFDGGGKGRGKGRRRARDTVRAVWNWLGSPQTALTATFFNIHQMRACLDAAKRLGETERSLFGEGESAVARDAYYVLSCIGQFELPADTAGMECFLSAVVYGLFRPSAAGASAAAASMQSSNMRRWHGVVDGDDSEDRRRQAECLQAAERWTRELLRAMARQMRRSRRLGIYATLASIFLFFVAYAASVVLAFAEGLGERTTTHSLAFGILITWLPLLLLFSILDRNPNSADRTREFVHRWLWNVRAVREWEGQQMRAGRRQRQSHREGGEEDMAPRQPYWWTKRRENDLLAMRAAAASGRVGDDSARVTGHNLLGDACCGVRIPPQRQCRHELGTFVGQGRKMGYYGLALSVVDAVKTNPAAFPGRENGQVAAAATDPQILVDKTRKNLGVRPPLAWRILALTALAMVWWELGMALMISYNIPTVGIGCRSGSYLVYGGLSTVPWLAHVYQYLVLGPSRGSSTSTTRGWLRTGVRQVGEWIGVVLDGIAAFCMLMAVPCLVFITFAAFSGVLKNCTCRGGVNRYIDFESAALYSNPAIFNVRVWWIVAASTAAIPVVMSFVVALPLLVFKLKPLWQEEQEQEEEQGQDVDEEGLPLLQGAYMEWVAR